MKLPSILLGLALATSFTSRAQADTPIPTGSQTATDTLAANGTYDVSSGQTLNYSGTTEAVLARDLSGLPTSTTINVDGGIIALHPTTSTTNPNAVFLQGSVGTTIFNVNVSQDGLIQATDATALRLKSGGGILNVDNQGQIISQQVAGSTGFGDGIDAGAAGGPDGATDYTSGGIITNGSLTNSAASITDGTNIGIDMGRNMTVDNYGSIISTSQGSNPGRGIEFDAANYSQVNNYEGADIEGATAGVDATNGNSVGLIVNNSGTIIGHNGSGIGADTTGADPGTFIVTNTATGKIYGENSGVSPNSDPDGIDIDGGATIYNYGLVETTAAASGYDARGRLNTADGLSIGGGNVFNYKGGEIISAQNGVTVNDDSFQSRSGSTALNLENDGLIQGQDGYAIRSENKPSPNYPGGVNPDTGLSNDNDTVVNTGTIIGGTANPAADPSQVFLLQGGAVDDDAFGTLNGITYNGDAHGNGGNGTYTDANGVTHPGDIRFVGGDGSAIQMGEGNDVITNTGAIYGTLDGTMNGPAGRAINLEGGDDTLNLEQGSIIVGDIDGGNGDETVGDNLNLDLDDTLGLHELSTDGTADGIAITADSTKSDTFTFAGAILDFEHVNAVSGKTILTGNSTYNGETIIGGGSVKARLEQDGTHTETNGATGALDYHVENNGTLAGSGTVTLATAATLVTIDQGGRFAPGSTAGPGKFTLAQGSVAMNGEMDFRLDGTDAGTDYDQFSLLNGTFTLGATSTLGLSLGYDPTAGDAFTLVDNEGTAAIAGTFAGLAQNATFDDGGQEFRISYTGGDGNDIVVTDLGAVPEPSTYALMLGSAGFLILLARRKLNAQV